MKLTPYVSQRNLSLWKKYQKLKLSKYIADVRLILFTVIKYLLLNFETLE